MDNAMCDMQYAICNTHYAVYITLAQSGLCNVASGYYCERFGGNGVHVAHVFSRATMPCNSFEFIYAVVWLSGGWQVAWLC